MDYTIAALRAFLAVYEARSVSRAADRLFISQPSVTYSLNRLRQLFADDLFTRRGTEMTPTAVARELYPRVREAVRVLDDVLRGPEGFDPSVSRRTFRLQLTDIGAATLLPRVLVLVAEAAPRVRIEAGQLDLARAPALAAGGDLDAFVCTPHLDDPRLRRDELFEQHYLGVCAAAHPRLPSRPTLRQYLAEGHVAAAEDGGHQVIGEALDALGTPRDVRVVLRDLLAVPALVASTEYVGYVPRVVARCRGVPDGVRFFDLPVDPPRTTVSLYTPRREVTSPELAWLREILLEAFGSPALRDLV